MALSYATTNSTIASLPPIATPSFPKKKASFWIKKDARFSFERIASKLTVSRNESSSIEYDVPFPSDYEELLDQAKKATELAFKDNKQLMVSN
ncbi:unnamed protein product [Dovyalis caffra]|uniref:Uncharacterized protein n=1 Tax=Dovyalis caffra TaxID=77055 RepID=A0AAV1SR38_9ROSI|nr:unnamed protein product [Dovyalis caffra]